MKYGPHPLVTKRKHSVPFYSNYRYQFPTKIISSLSHPLLLNNVIFSLFLLFEYNFFFAIAYRYAKDRIFLIWEIRHSFIF